MTTPCFDVIARLDSVSISAFTTPRASRDGTLAGRAAALLARALLGDRAVEAEARALYSEAAAARDAAVACDATSIQAFAALAEDHARATELSRRASRMARTEALPDQESLANLVLARVRRLTGRPYLATRILGALVRLAPPSFAAWIAWELVLSGGPDAVATLALTEPHASLLAMIEAARGGDRAALDRAFAALNTKLAGLPGFLNDVAIARSALDARASLDADPPELAAFRRGDLDEPPLGILGLAASADDDDAPVSIACFGARAVRFLSIAAPLTGVTARLEASQRKQGRTDIALAVLALAGDEGMREEELFRRAYGFAFARNVHRGVLDVLLHRARKHLDAHGELARDEGHLTLRLNGPLILVDPRCSPREDDRVLRMVARRGKATAKEASDALGIPLRSAQAALESLLQVGACTRERQGRSVEYRVDDTTFQEPTAR